MKHLLLAVVLLSGCAGIPRATQGGRLLDAWAQISTRDFIRVRGIGVVVAGAQGQTARRGASRNAALVNARYNLLALIKGVKLEGGITIAQLAEKDSLIREIADEVVSGGEEVLTEWLPDDGCVITLELKRSKVERLIQEKSRREKGLEVRIDKDIAEIKKLRAQVMVLAAGRYNTSDLNELETRARRAADNWGRLDHAQKLLDSTDGNNSGAMYEVNQELITVILNLCTNPDGSPNGDCK